MRHRFWIGAAVAALAGGPAAGDIQYFTSHTVFTQYVLEQGKFLKDIEDFEESQVQDGQKIAFPNSLQNGVPRPAFPNGIDATNLIIQTNETFGPTPPTPNPSAFENALWVNGPGFIGSNSKKVGNDEFLRNAWASLDLIFTDDDKTAIGVDLSTYQNYNQGHNGFIISVYDVNDNVLGVYQMLGNLPVEPAKNFFGVWSDTPIGRLNVWGLFAVPQPFAVDNIEMWRVPEPGSALLLAAASLLLLRRNRNN